MVTLNYLFPDGQVIVTTVNATTPFFDAWLDSMVTMNPDTIFFFTVPTTDVFGELTTYV